VRSIRVLVLRMARDNAGWGYRRVRGELLVLGVKVAASTVWHILQDAGVGSVPPRWPRSMPLIAARSASEMPAAARNLRRFPPTTCSSSR
jgi:putative transposase